MTKYTFMNYQNTYTKFCITLVNNGKTQRLQTETMLLF